MPSDDQPSLWDHLPMAGPPATDPQVAKRRNEARQAATAIREWLQDPGKGGSITTIHVLLGRPRRGMWLRTWSSLPGFMQELKSQEFTHTLLPGWAYTPAEMKTEMIDDLDRFAVTGLLPKSATR